VVAVAACLAAGAVVGVVLLQTRHAQTGTAGVGKPRQGAPPLFLDLGVRIDPQAQALRRAQQLYASGKRAEAATIFSRYDSLEARLGQAFAGWPAGGLDRVKQLVASHPHSAEAELALALAYLWAGRNADGAKALQAVRSAHPDTQSAVYAGDLLYPGPPGVPGFVPTFSPPRRIEQLPPPQRLAALARAARAPDAHAKLLYGVALQYLGRNVSAERQFAAAARLAPHDPEARVAAVLGTFDRAHPERLFPRLGPLVRTFPKAATVRFHLGYALLWIKAYGQARKELLLAVRLGPGTVLAQEAETLISTLGGPGTK
jgi:tetratricopeptide (TPR) repeat protein